MDAINQFIEQCQAAIGSANVLTTEDDKRSFLTEWRQRVTGKAIAILKPKTTLEVASLVRLCLTSSIKIVPQGGNTGLVLGSIPDQEGNAVVISLIRLNQVRQVDPINNTMQVEAGCLLHQVQAAAAQANRLFPLSLASEGSCTIGGNLATNAGGTAVLRYGNARELCLGLEVVTATGEIWNGLRSLRKDNTGYDLRDIFIGSEGSLGIITAAVIKLFPQPQSTLTAFVALNSIESAIALLSLIQSHFDAMLTGFELMSHYCLSLVKTHFPDSPTVFATPSAQYVLIELSSHLPEVDIRTQLEHVLATALQQQVINDAVVANSLEQSQQLWKIRESISAAQTKQGKNIKHDISLPISHIADFIAETDADLQQAFPACRMVVFGHLGDGNLHYNIAAPETETEAGSTTDDNFLMQQSHINKIVHDNVHRYGGSISAEHGIGALKKEMLHIYKSPIEIALMQSIKSALDPSNIMNPGKVI